LEEYLTVKKDFDAGCQTEVELQEVKKRFISALNNYIDWRVDGVIEERVHRDFKKASDQTTDVITTNIGYINASVVALTRAPVPIKNQTLPLRNYMEWMKVYNRWYNKERKKALLEDDDD